MRVDSISMAEDEPSAPAATASHGMTGCAGFPHLLSPDNIAEPVRKSDRRNSFAETYLLIN
jgi:hypothetical protein